MRSGSARCSPRTGPHGRLDRRAEDDRPRGRADVARELPALARAENDAAQEALVKRGTTVTRLTASGRAAFIAATRRVYGRWAGAMDADLVREAEAAVKAAPR